MVNHHDKSRRSRLFQPPLSDHYGFQKASRRYRLESDSMLRKITLSLCLFVFVVSSDTSLKAQSGAKNGEWRTYGADLGNTHYSPLEQINASNFNRLQGAWRFKTESLGPRPETNLESTPLMANGVVFSTAGSRRVGVALGAATSELMWSHRGR